MSARHTLLRVLLAAPLLLAAAPAGAEDEIPVICASCGWEILPGHRFCGNCGAPASGEPGAASAAPSAPEAEQEPAPAPSPDDGASAPAASGAPAILKEDAPQRALPTFAHALDPKKPEPDESDVYSKPVEQKEKLEEWKM